MAPVAVSERWPPASDFPAPSAFVSTPGTQPLAAWSNSWANVAVAPLTHDLQRAGPAQWQRPPCSRPEGGQPRQSGPCGNCLLSSCLLAPTALGFPSASATVVPVSTGELATGLLPPLSTLGLPRPEMRACSSPQLPQQWQPAPALNPRWDWARSPPGCHLHGSWQRLAKCGPGAGMLLQAWQRGWGSVGRELCGRREDVYRQRGNRTADRGSTPLTAAGTPSGTLRWPLRVLQQVLTWEVRTAKCSSILTPSARCT